MLPSHGFLGKEIPQYEDLRRVLAPSEDVDNPLFINTSHMCPELKSKRSSNPARSAFADWARCVPRAVLLHDDGFAAKKALLVGHTTALLLTWVDQCLTF
jgi:hypothetical protein